MIPDTRRKTNKKPPATVLVTVDADGWIQVYGDTHVQVKILNLPEVSTIENEIRREELLDSILPTRYKDVFWPGPNVRATGNIRRTTLEDVDRIVHSLAILYSIGEPKAEHFPTPKSKQLAALEA